MSAATERIGAGVGRRSLRGQWGTDGSPAEGCANPSCFLSQLSKGRPAPLLSDFPRSGQSPLLQWCLSLPLS